MSHALSRRPHPILKRDSSPFKSPVLPFPAGAGPLFSPHVHFPPTPSMIAATYPAHSPTTYDRKPIIVSPNVVQIPRRGDRKLHSPSVDFNQEPRGRSPGRGRRGKLSDGRVKGSYFHPRAYEACKPETSRPASPTPSELPQMPTLVQDLSPSDESDDSVLTPPGDTTLGSSTSSRPEHAPSIGHAMPLHLPEAVKARRSSMPDLELALDSAPLRSLPPPPRSSCGKRLKPARRKGAKDDTGSFSPELDEGCLGGF